MQKLTRTSSCKSSENEPESVMRFDKSLKELRELRTQLHYAADYCESTFLNTKEKKMAVENTKEYICRAVVAVVDHLGSVSANLNRTISNTNQFSEAEVRIDTLNQRLVSCEQYAQKLALTRLTWHPNLPRFHRRYLSTPTILSVDKSDEDVKMEPNSVACENKHGFEAEDLPLFLYTCTPKPSFSRTWSTKSIDKDESTSAVVLPVRDGVSILSKTPNPTFHFQQISQKHGRYNLFRKSIHSSNDILSLIRRIKRTT